MKLIESNNKTVTLQFSRAELGNLWKAVCVAMYALQEKPIMKRGKPFFPTVQNLA